MLHLKQGRFLLNFATQGEGGLNLPTARPRLKSASDCLKVSGRKDPVRTIVLADFWLGSVLEAAAARNAAVCMMVSVP